MAYGDREQFDTRTGVGPGGVVIMEDAECGPQSPDLWREPPLPEDPNLRARRLRIRDLLHRSAFVMPGWDEATQGRSPIPFFEKSPDEVALMPDALRASYLAERAAAADPRSGPRLVPYVPQARE
ncbi:hypothetical protein KC973_00875 [Candidatus Saccharibacteria bacterium]|nr:hypothetical protein [Candidatus Saccharibacteria bacterium]